MQRVLELPVNPKKMMARLEADFPMSETEWEIFMGILLAMKPSIVVPDMPEIRIENLMKHGVSA